MHRWWKIECDCGLNCASNMIAKRFKWNGTMSYANKKTAEKMKNDQWVA